MARLQIKNKLTDYEDFVEKFKPKKTTDDCYTPQPVYDALLAWGKENMPSIRGASCILRPFWPGNDYKNAEYPHGCVVVDNPPFSILTQIVRYYVDKNVKFLLFSPHLTSTHFCGIPGVTVICPYGKIKYENGATVPTAFVTNCWPRDTAIVIDAGLGKRLQSAQKTETERCNKYVWPQNVINMPLLGKYASGQLEIPRSEVVYVHRLDCGSRPYGGALLVSDGVAAELRAAELRAAELRAAELRAAELRADEIANKVQLSEREKEIIRSLNKIIKQPKTKQQ